MQKFSSDFPDRLNVLPGLSCNFLLIMITSCAEKDDNPFNCISALEIVSFEETFTFAKLSATTLSEEILPFKKVIWDCLSAINSKLSAFILLSVKEDRRLERDFKFGHSIVRYLSCLNFFPLTSGMRKRVSFSTLKIRLGLL